MEHDQYMPYDGLKKAREFALDGKFALDKKRRKKVGLKKGGKVKFQKTKYYPVNIDTRVIIDMPFKRERDFFVMFRGSGYIGIKGKRLNDHKCYAEFDIKPNKINS